MSRPEWVKSQHISWASVCTSGWVDVEWAARGFREDVGGESAYRHLPPGYRVSLKHIDKDDMAYVYRGDTGVMKVPAWCLEPWQR